MSIEPELSPQADALLRMAIAGQFSPAKSSSLTVSQLVQYLCGVVPENDVPLVERAMVENPTQVTLLAQIFRILKTLQNQTWESLQNTESEDPLTDQIRKQWIETASESLISRNFPEFTLEKLCLASEQNVDDSRIARGILACLQTEGLAPKRPELVASTRSRSDLPHMEGFDVANLNLRFSAAIDSSGILTVSAIFSTEPPLASGNLWIAFEINRQWMGLGSCRLEGGNATLQVQGFGSLLGLSEGPLPPELFTLRMDEWPSVCAVGALVVQSASHPFAEIESEPLIDGGSVSVDIRLLPQSEELRKADAVELWFGTGGQVWQLLGRWPIPKIRENKMTLICPSPKPGLVGIAFPGVLKLALRH